MRKTKALIIALLCPLFILAQPRMSKNKMKKIESQKIAFLTKELDLSPKEAQEFWPVYNQYSEAKKENRKKKHDNMRDINLELISEEEAKLSFESHQKIKKEEMEIETEYFEKFTKILGYKRTINLLIAEAKFKKELLHRIRKKKVNKHNTERER